MVHPAQQTTKIIIRLQKSPLCCEPVQALTPLMIKPGISEIKGEKNIVILNRKLKTKSEERLKNIQKTIEDLPIIIKH